MQSSLQACKWFRGKGAQTIILTLGERGSYVYDLDNKGTVVPADAVKAIDTSGAGDAFLGALAYYISRYPGLSLEEKVRRSGLIASKSVQSEGTQKSFPSRGDVAPDLL